MCILSNIADGCPIHVPLPHPFGPYPNLYQNLLCIIHSFRGTVAMFISQFSLQKLCEMVGEYGDVSPRSSLYCGSVECRVIDSLCLSACTCQVIKAEHNVCRVIFSRHRIKTCPERSILSRFETCLEKAGNSAFIQSDLQSNLISLD